MADSEDSSPDKNSSQKVGLAGILGFCDARHFGLFHGVRHTNFLAAGHPACHVVDHFYNRSSLFNAADCRCSGRSHFLPQDKAGSYHKHRLFVAKYPLSVLCVGAKWHVENVVHASLRQQNITQQAVLTIPSPFNILLWRIVVMDDKGYYEGYYSLFDKTDSIQVRQYPVDTGLLQGLEQHWPVKRLQWFTHGFYSVRQMENDIVIADLRMARGWDQLQQVWERIWRDLAI